RPEPAAGVDAGRPQRARRLALHRLHGEPHHDAAGVPAARDQAAEDRPAPGLGGGVKRLGILPPREGHDPVLGDGAGAERRGLPHPVVLEVLHRSPLRCEMSFGRPTRPQRCAAVNAARGLDLPAPMTYKGRAARAHPDATETDDMTAYKCLLYEVKD